VAVFSVIVAVFGFVILRSRERARSDAAAVERADLLIDPVAKMAGGAVVDVTALGALVTGKGALEADDLRSFTLSPTSGLTTVALARRVSDAELPALVEAQKATDPGFHVVEGEPGHEVAGSPRPEHVVVVAKVPAAAERP